MVLVVATLAVAPALACAQALTFGGSSGAVGTIRVLIEQFGKTHPSVVARPVPDLSSSGGIRAVLAGKLDMAVSSRPLEPSERQCAVQLELCRTPFVMAVAATSPPGSVTTSELDASYAGTRTHWPDGRPLRLIMSPADDADNELLWALSPGMRRAVLAAHARPGMLTEPTDRGRAETIADTPGALGTATLAFIRTDGTWLAPLALNGVTPSPDTIASGAYPMSKTIRLVVGRQAPVVVREFIGFVRSPQGRAVLRAAGYVPH